MSNTDGSLHEKPDLASKIAFTLGLLGAGLLGLGPLVANLRITPPMGGFLIFLVGLLLGVIALPIGMFCWMRFRATERRNAAEQALAATNTEERDPETRARNAAIRLKQINTKKRRILASLFLGTIATSVLLASLVGARNLPPINDITTDLENPPQFVAAAEEPANRGRDLSYPVAFAEQQRKAYPGLGPIYLTLPTEAALVKVQTAAQNLGWKIVSLDSAGALEAQDTSKLFHFVDDIVVRITPSEPTASSNAPSATTDGNTRMRIDIRSKSRDGQGDLGANANRIRRFRAAMLEDQTPNS